MKTALLLGLAILLGLAALVLVGRWAYARERAAKANGTFSMGFVWVEDDGSVRDLTADEHKYLNTEFHPGDGARPYVKSSYESKTPDGRIGGFLLRRRLPRTLMKTKP